MIFKKITLLAILLSWGPLSSDLWSEEKKPSKPLLLTYPGYEKPSCLTQPSVKNTSESYQKGVEKAQLALQKPYTSSESIWNQEVLSTKSHLREAIESYMKGERGKSIQDIKITGKKPDELHKELIAAGFTHERLPLKAPKQDRNYKYWRRDGTKTSDPQDAQVVPMDIYAHPDGGLIRVKPEGTPSPKYSHAVPQASKSVVYNLKPKEDQPLDTRYPNEAFKVTDEGMPLPKGLSPKTGMRFIHDRKEIPNMKEAEAEVARQELKGWISTVINASHIDLASDYSHCAKEDVKTTEPLKAESKNDSGKNQKPEVEKK